MRVIVSHRTLLRLTLLLALAIAAGPMLVGCTVSSGPSTAATSGTAGVSTATVSSASSATGSASPTSSGSTTGSTTGSTAGTTASSGSTSRIPANTPSGPLRLYCTPRTTLNPLADASASFQSISQLVYDGLFAIDGLGLTRPVLAEPETMTTAADGLSLTLRLAANRTFQNGAAVVAADVVASYTALRAAGAASAYSGSLPDITGITATDTRTLTITLSRPQPDIAWQLTFPVLPAAALATSAAKPLTIIPGTGPYRITAYAAGKGLTLQASDSSETGRKATVRTISAVELPSLHDALRAFERDGIDLVSLPADTYPAYALRNGLKLERYATEQYIFLSFRANAGSLLANPARLAFVLAASRAPAVSADLETLGVQPAAVPIHPDSPLWDATTFTLPGYLTPLSARNGGHGG